MRSSDRREGPRSLGDDERGAYQTEYTIVLVLLALVLAVAVGLLATPLVEYHDAVTRVLDWPVL